MAVPVEAVDPEATDPDQADMIAVTPARPKRSILKIPSAGMTVLPALFFCHLPFPADTMQL